MGNRFFKKDNERKADGIHRYTELYYDDALRFIQYLQTQYGGEIEIVNEDSDGFPLAPKVKELPPMIDCFKLKNIEVAYLRKRDGEDLKHRNANLYRFIMGQKIREVRELSGMTLEDVSKKCGYKPNNLRSIELGRYNADIDTLCNIVEAMDAHFEIMKD